MRLPIIVKHICLGWQPLPDVVSKTKKCTVMTAGEQQSSRSQDPNVRPQGIDYCLGFVMDVSAMHNRTENRRRRKLFVSEITATSFGNVH